MIKTVLGFAAGTIVIVKFWDIIKPILGLSRFGKDADFKIRRHYDYRIEGGIDGELTFLIDLDVINKSNSEILANNLLITAYNEKGQYVGQSVPFNNSVVIQEATLTTITGIKVTTQLKNVLFDYAGPFLLELIQNQNIGNQKIGRTITLDINVELNGIRINKTETINI